MLIIVNGSIWNYVLYQIFVESFLNHAFVSLFCVSKSDTFSTGLFKSKRMFIECKTSISTVLASEPVPMSSESTFCMV